MGIGRHAKPAGSQVPKIPDLANWTWYGTCSPADHIHPGGEGEQGEKPVTEGGMIANLMKKSHISLSEEYGILTLRERRNGNVGGGAKNLDLGSLSSEPHDPKSLAG